MNMNQIEYFLDIAKTNSINSTATRKFTSQQAVSASIHKLESELGVRLLNRSKTGVTLTYSGRLLLDKFQMMQNLYTDIIQFAEEQKYADTHQETLRLGFTPLMAKIHLPKLLPHFYDCFCNIRINTIELPRDMLLEMLQKGKLDFAICGITDPHILPPSKYTNFKHILTDDAYVKEILSIEQLLCFAHYSNPLSSQSVLNYHAIKEQKCTIFSDEPSLLRSENCLHSSLSQNIHEYFLREYHTICILPESASDLFTNKKNLVGLPITPSLQFTNYLLYSKDYLSLIEETNENPPNIYQFFLQQIHAIIN